MVRIETVAKGYFQKISDFLFLKKIGVGSFGEVNLAVHKPTKKKYAIKVIDLSGDLSEAEIKLIQRQLKTHALLDHPHIIKLWDTLQQNNRVYMIMEYAVNGSLFQYHTGLLSKGRQPSQQEVYRFFSQTLSALNYMHSHDYMHRDIKPENILLDEDYNIKICDFGWVTNQITQPRTTFCGTYQYMAPEMVFEKSYDYKIDTWAIGILLYELIHGKAPFPGETLNEVKEKIKKGTYQISRNIPSALKSLIIDILQLKPQKRLGINQIVSHPWIKFNESHGILDKQETSRIINLRGSNQSLKQINISKSQQSKHNYPSTNKGKFQTKHKKLSQIYQPIQNDNFVFKDREPQIFQSLLTESQETIKKHESQKRIKKKCKTQGEEQLLGFEQFLPDKNKTTYKKSYEFIFGESLPMKKPLFMKQNENKQHSGQQYKRIKKLGKGNKGYDKNNAKIDKIEKKLSQLSYKFHQQKAREKLVVGNRRFCYQMN